MELKKSYKGFAVWTVLFLVCMFGCAFLPIEDAALMSRVVLNVCCSGVAVMTFVIYKTGYVYWYNGTTYEAALKAGPERRKKYAWRHFKAFGLFALGFLVFTIFAQMFQIPIYNDIWIAVAGLVGTAVSTIRIKL